uniref:Protein phosphatase inhibitor 2 n=1 Tax=Anopheles epiroticus TaxID=199890 RepID=A0A182PIG9_9DIPT
MSFSSDSPDAKKPCKGILKSSSSFDKHSAASSVHRKSAKFDELNVLQTYHPPDKDYGHMKVDEPKTPFNYVESDDVDHLDAELLAERLRVAADSQSDDTWEKGVEDEDDEEEEEEELTEEQKKRKLEFERRRKAHYNEFEAVKLARKLIEEDDEDDEEDEEANKGTSSSANTANPSETGASSSTSPGKDDGTGMEIEEIEEAAGGHKAKTADSPVARLKPVSSSIILEECSNLESPRSSVIALIMIVSICLMIFFIVCFTLLFYLLKRNDD